MSEIARVFAEGLQGAGLPATVLVDQYPDLLAGPDLFQLVVAPHEYFPLFAERRAPATVIRAINRTVYLLNVEQPGTGWFERAFRYHRRARGWLDISRLGVEEMRRRGAAALHAPLGCPAWFGSGPGEIDREVDLIYLASWSPRRETFLARAAPDLAHYRTRLHIMRLEETRRAETPGFLVGEALASALRESRALLSLHSFKHDYFEWHRALRAIANGCALVTESSTGFEPLVEGRDFIAAEEADLLDRAVDLLEHEPRRRDLAASARKVVLEKLDPARLASELLEKLARPERSFVAFGRWLERRSTRVRWRGWQAIRGVVDSPKTALRALHWLRQRIQLPTQWSLVLLQLTRAVQSLVAPPISSAEHRNLRRELASAVRGTGVPTWKLFTNDAWRATPEPGLAVVATLYNYDNWIGECIESVWASELGGVPGGVEIVLVDDHSTNLARVRALELLERSPLPMAVAQKWFNTGLADARNVGLEVARAPYYFILDADNRLFPRALAALHREVVEGRRDAVYGIIRTVTEGGEPIGLTSCYSFDERQLVRRPYIDAMALFRRQTVLDLGGYATDLYWHGWEDYDLWLKLSGDGRSCSQLPELVGAYRVHPNSMLRDTDLYTLHIARHLRKKFRTLAEKYPDLDELFAYPRNA